LSTARRASANNWRNRYHALTLHNQVQVTTCPICRFPPNWPVYIPKDKLANWFEAYVDAMELNYWTGKRVRERRLRRSGRAMVGAAAADRWQQARVASAACRDGDRRQRHSEPAGYSRLERFSPARCCIPASMATARPGKAKKALVIGTGNSGHDIAQDLHSSALT